MSEEKTQKVHLVSLGCPKNTVDSERMLGLLQGNDYVLTEDPKSADVLIVNTCGFIGPAKEESIDAIMQAHRLKEEGCCKGVIVTGCLATRYQQELQAELKEADQILTIEQEPDIVQNVDALLGIERASEVVNHMPRLTMTPAHWAYLRISDGCDHKCAFCAIPAIRGRHKSEPIERLVSEATRLAQSGARELVLVSQDSVRYGVDLYGEARLVPLLQALSEVEGIEWLRLMYTYPAFWTEEMIDFYATNDKMCAYIDMPLQHINDDVLRRMKRATTRKKTIDLLGNLRQRLPGVGLRSTFIVGFPGETEEEFEELLEFIEVTRFDHVSGFVYSPEEGTLAFDLDGEVPQVVAEERYSRLSRLQEMVSAERNDKFIGTRHNVLVDEETADGYAGRTERDAPEIDGQVAIKGKAVVGKFVEVEITGAYAYELSGETVGSPW